MAEEKVYKSEDSTPEDSLWLAHGAKILEDSMPSIRLAATEILKTFGVLQTAYLAILGFAKIIPENFSVFHKLLFLLPFIPWSVGTYYALRVMKTDIVNIKLNSPSDIKEKTSALLQRKQQYLDMAFIHVVFGLIVAFVMIVFRLSF